MHISIVTQEELLALKEDIIESLEVKLNELLSTNSQTPEIVLLKSHQVQRLLGISPGTLQNMRVNRTIPFSKVGGIIFYEKHEILRLIQDNKMNSQN